MLVVTISHGIDDAGDPCTQVRDHTTGPEETELEFLQRLVGGPIEVIEAGPHVSAFVHEEGKFIYQRNQLATIWWLTQLVATPYTPRPDDFVAGPLVIAGPVDAEGNTTSITREGFDSITRAIESAATLGSTVVSRS